MVNFFKKKSRAELIDSKVADIIHQILIEGYSNAEIGLILKTIQEDGKYLLEHRRALLIDELHATVEAINKL